MAYDEKLAVRIRKLVAEEPGVAERKMFGGLAFMRGGNMFCGPIGDNLMVRVGAAAYDEALAQPHARPLDFTGRPMKGMVHVDAAGLNGDSLAGWVERGLSFARTLPAK